jgi:hypothetical protein
MQHSILARKAANVKPRAEIVKHLCVCVLGCAQKYTISRFMSSYV